jgi:hypothetical protein
VAIQEVRGHGLPRFARNDGQELRIDFDPLWRVGGVRTTIQIVTGWVCAASRFLCTHSMRRAAYIQPAGHRSRQTSAHGQRTTGKEAKVSARNFAATKLEPNAGRLM